MRHTVGPVWGVALVASPVVSVQATHFNWFGFRCKRLCHQRWETLKMATRKHEVPIMKKYGQSRNCSCLLLESSALARSFRELMVSWSGTGSF